MRKLFCRRVLLQRRVGEIKAFQSSCDTFRLLRTGVLGVAVEQHLLREEAKQLRSEVKRLRAERLQLRSRMEKVLRAASHLRPKHLARKFMGRVTKICHKPS